MKPMLMESDLTGRVYVVTRYKDRGDGRYEAQTKYDVTDQFLAIHKRRVENDAKIREVADHV
jgi:hypothetical protein